MTKTIVNNNRPDGKPKPVKGKWIGNFDTKHMVDSDNIFMSYNNIIQSLDVLIMKILIRNYDKFNKEFNLDFLKDCSDERLILMALNRKEKNIFEWLARDKNYKDTDGMYEKYLNKLPFSYEREVCTDFIYGYRLYMSTQSAVNKLVVATGNNENKKELCRRLFANNIDKLYFADDDEKTLEHYVTNKDYNVLFIDRTDLIRKHVNNEALQDKVFCVPYIGYLFEFVRPIEDLDPLLVSKDRIELLTDHKRITVGFLHPFKIRESMFGKG